MKPAKSRVREWLAVTLLAATVSLVLALTMGPTPLDQGFESTVDRLLAILHRNGVPAWFGYNKLEFSANVLMFIPLGFLISTLLPVRVWWLALIATPILSIAIELTQATLLTARFATVADVLANSIGGLIGAIAAVGLRYVVHKRDEAIVARALWDRAHSAN